MNKYQQILLDHLGQVVLTVLWLLVALVYFFRWHESNLYVEVPAAPQQIKLSPMLPNAAMERVRELIAEQPPIEDSQFVTLMQFDMFDVQMIPQKAEFERRANERYADAQSAFDRGELDEAKAICEEITHKIYPYHLAAKDLLAEIKKLEQAEEEAAEAEQAAAQAVQAEEGE
jgi:hypothetical protein